MRNPLSHHEIAALFVLFSAPRQVALADPEAATLQQERLVEVVPKTATHAELRLTSEGKALVARLGLTKIWQHCHPGIC
ncbi:hypothetical protein SAMN02787142_0587 [Burkholderia sp. WP9]|nr:hypothetical protein SAMN02787142_0587 [Burkholderia sp. WP9]